MNAPMRPWFPLVMCGLTGLRAAIAWAYPNALNIGVLVFCLLLTQYVILFRRP